MGSHTQLTTNSWQTCEKLRGWHQKPSCPIHTRSIAISLQLGRDKWAQCEMECGQREREREWWRNKWFMPFIIHVWIVWTILDCSFCCLSVWFCLFQPHTNSHTHTSCRSYFKFISIEIVDCFFVVVTVCVCVYCIYWSCVRIYTSGPRRAFFLTFHWLFIWYFWTSIIGKAQRHHSHGGACYVHTSQQMERPMFLTFNVVYIIFNSILAQVFDCRMDPIILLIFFLYSMPLFFDGSNLDPI